MVLKVSLPFKNWCYTKIYFAENQLSSDLISLSPLIAGHPKTFRRLWVRSTTCLQLDHLTSGVIDKTHCKLLTLIKPTITNNLSLLYKLSCWPIIQKVCYHHQRYLTACLKICFTSFHSGSGIFFTFPSRYSFTIAHKSYLVLDGGPPILKQRNKYTALLTKANQFIINFYTFIRALTYIASNHNNHRIKLYNATT